MLSGGNKTLALTILLLSVILINRETYARQAIGSAGSSTAPLDFFKLPDSVIADKPRLYDFTLLPHAIPCIAMKNGIFLLGVNEWLLPPRSLPVRSVLYNSKDSSIFMLSPGMRNKTMLTKLSISTGQYSFIDSLDGAFYRIFDFSEKYFILTGKESDHYGLWLYHKQEGYMSPIYESKIPITSMAVYKKTELLVASGGMLIHLGNDLKVKQVFPISYDIDGLATLPGNKIIISTVNGIISIEENKNAAVVADKLHGVMKQYNNAIFILDEVNHQLIKNKIP